METFSEKIPKVEIMGACRKSKRERGIWQRRYWEHQIRDDADLEAHVAYIYMNPEKHETSQERVIGRIRQFIGKSAWDVSMHIGEMAKIRRTDDGVSDFPGLAEGVCWAGEALAQPTVLLYSLFGYRPAADIMEKNKNDSAKFYFSLAIRPIVLGSASAISYAKYAGEFSPRYDA